MQLDRISRREITMAAVCPLMPIRAQTNVLATVGTLNLPNWRSRFVLMERASEEPFVGWLESHTPANKPACSPFLR